MRQVCAVWVLGLALLPAGGGLAQGVGRLGGGAAPVLLSAPSPEYTQDARAKKISGNVLVHLMVGADGVPTDVRVVRGLGYGLDEKAVEAVKQYRFRPARREGQPVEVAMNVEVNFQVF